MDTERNATILLYHGVTTAPSHGIENFSGKHVRAAEFERHMAFLAANTTVLPLRELAARVARGAALPQRAVAVTFDDTFRNVHDVGLRILRRYDIPATFFVTSGFIGTNRRFWVDRVEHCLNRTGRERVDVAIDGERLTFPLRGDEDRIGAVRELKQRLKNVPPPLRDACCADLAAATGVSDGGDDVPNYANMDGAQVARLDAPPKYEVGGHTVNHEILAYLDRAALEYEVSGCQRQLKAIIGREIDLFSYPEGQAHHFNDMVIGELKRGGVIICPTAIAGVNPPGTNPFRLKRIMPGFMGTAFPFDCR